MILLAVDFGNLHTILRNLYTEMLPICNDMATVGKAIAGIAALFFIGSKVWAQLARAEPIDFYPLLRPFALGLCIMFFQTLVLGTINTIMSPIVVGTNKILESQTFDMEEYSKQRKTLEYEAMIRNPETAYLVSNEEFDKKIDALGWGVTDMAKMGMMYGERTMYQMEQKFRGWFKDLLEIMFQAAALILDTIRTFFLIVLALLGPIVFALACFPGFETGLTTWITRYIQIYFWLPVSDLFSAIIARIQVLMLKADIEALNDPTYIPDTSNVAFIIFMMIGIVGYFTVPTVSAWIISAGSMGDYSKNIKRGGAMAAAAAGSVAGNIAGRLTGRKKK